MKIRSAPDIQPTVARPTAPPSERRRGPLRRFLAAMTAGSWIGVDWLIIGSGAIGACAALTYGTAEYAWLDSPWRTSLYFCAAMLVAGLVFGLYDRDTLLARSRILFRGVLTASLGVVLALAVEALFFYGAISRWVGLAVGLAFLLVALPLRLLAHELISVQRVRLICVGAGDSVRKLVDILGRCHRRHYEVLGHISVPQGLGRLVAGATHDGRALRFRSEAELEFTAACPRLGSLDDIAEVLAQQRVDEVVVGSELALDSHVGHAVATCLEGRCRVTDQATFIEKLLGEVPAESITAEWFLRADVQSRGNHETVSRVVDIGVAALGLALTLPLWPLIALVIRLDSHGPAIFRQLRVGQHGRCFEIYKFRTMRVDAERDGARWAEERDTRITRVGQFLRHSRLDELPQLWNILRGDMALVGPRPERPEFVHHLEQLLPHYRFRHLIRPGLTGWAQIHYGYGASVADAHRKLCFDLYYLKHRSFELDLAILIRTIGTFVLGAR
jgi:exopolysaccharide biosynthesis polyprenyl glycosylphosphotransferase